MMSAKPLRVLTVFGTRPEAIKMAPVVRALQEHPRTEVEVIVTGQHREILDQVLELFSITPDRDLNVMRPRQTLYGLTATTLQGMATALEGAEADVTLVQGDTTTAFAAGLASFYAKIPVGHIEAGLRTETIYEPFPEEMNRRMLSTISEVHFAPTSGSLQNLLAGGISRDKIYVTGNTVTDALVQIAENLGEPMREVCRGLKELVARHPDFHVVFSVHPNPAVREVVFPELEGHERVHLLEPVDYTTLITLIRECTLILTDSGGIQEEAPSLGKPVLVLRRQTERPEGVVAGVAELMGTDRPKIVERASRLWTDPEAYRAMSMVASPYGDGQAARRTVEALLHAYRGEARPLEFSTEAVGA